MVKSNSEKTFLKNNNSLKNNLSISYSNNYNEIERKIEEYSNKLRNNLNKAIDEEKLNEIKRSNEYNNANDINDKKKIEEKNALERNNANIRILKMKDNIEKDIKSYEDKLRRDYKNE